VRVMVTVRCGSEAIPLPCQTVTDTCGAMQDVVSEKRRGQRPGVHGFVGMHGLDVALEHAA